MAPVTGFWLDRPVQGVEDFVTVLPAAPNVQFSQGDACLIDTATGSGTAGLLIQATAQTTSPRYAVLSVMAQSDQIFPLNQFFNGPLRQTTYNLTNTSAQGGSQIMCLDAGANPQLVLATQFTSAGFEGAANANSTVNQVLFSLAGGASNQLCGGTLYCNETGQQFTIVTDSYSSPVHTTTVFPYPASGVAITSTNTLRVTAFGKGGVTGVKLQPSSNFWQGISTVFADSTGGHILIHDVDLSKRIAYVRFSGNGILAV
jgi:hypothetical protein